MNDQARRAFCYFGRLKLNTELDSILSLLPQKEQILVRVVLSELKQLSDDEIRQRLTDTLEAEP